MRLSVEGVYRDLTSGTGSVFLPLAWLVVAVLCHVLCWYLLTGTVGALPFLSYLGWSLV